MVDFIVQQSVDVFYLLRNNLSCLFSFLSFAFGRWLFDSFGCAIIMTVPVAVPMAVSVVVL